MEIKSFYVQESDSGLRLDRLFYRCLENFSYRFVNKLIRKGQIRINGKRVKNYTRVSPGEFVKVPMCINNNNTPKVTSTLPVNFRDSHKKLMSNKIYEDTNIIAFNKPSGLCVQDGTKVSISVDRILKIVLEGSHIVHRLDKETTGLLMVAKSHAAAASVSKLFREKKISKTYVAILSAIPKILSGSVKSPVEREDTNNTEESYAETKYKIIAQSEDNLCIVLFQPLTGKKHQLRQHALALEAPIMGDTKYYSCTDLKRKKRSDFLYLHACKMIFNLDNKLYNLSAPLPQHFHDVIEKHFPDFKTLLDYSL